MENEPAAGASSGGKIDDAEFQQNIADTKAFYAEMRQLNLEYKYETAADNQANKYSNQISA